MRDEFKNHVATYSMLRDDHGNEIERLVWAKPDTGIFRINYLRENHRLFVSGDLGGAVYQWGEAVTLEWISGLNLDYFAGKCMASEEGRRFVEWNEKEARRRLIEYFRDYLRDDAGGARERFRAFRECGGFNALENPFEWNVWLQNADAPYMLGQDYWEKSDIGEVIAIRCRLHMEGLKAAMEQLGQCRVGI